MCPLPTSCQPLPAYWGWRAEWGRESLDVVGDCSSSQNIGALSILFSYKIQPQHHMGCCEGSWPCSGQNQYNMFLDDSVADCNSSNSLLGRKKVVLVDKQRVEVTSRETQWVLPKAYLYFEVAAQKHSHNKFQYQEDKWCHNTKENRFCDCDVKEKGK